MKGERQPSGGFSRTELGNTIEEPEPCIYGSTIVGHYLSTWVQEGHLCEQEEGAEYVVRYMDIYDRNDLVYPQGVTHTLKYHRGYFWVCIPHTGAVD